MIGLKHRNMSILENHLCIQLQICSQHASSIAPTLLPSTVPSVLVKPCPLLLPPPKEKTHRKHMKTGIPPSPQNFNPLKSNSEDFSAGTSLGHGKEELIG